ncbi:MAG: hypothetical protein MK085_04680 [Phycisphaerales bacterium]|nr:hypothetical protein [Phycisphaerales bacterium]
MQHGEFQASGFLPDDYLQKRRERRTHAIGIVLFVLVMVGVATAFMVTDRNWNEVRDARQVVNTQFKLASDQIAAMEAYEHRVAQMVEKAHVAVGLIDSVPKSNLLADIVARMPEGLSLVRFHYDTEELKPARSRGPGVRTLAGASSTGDPASTPDRPTVRKWHSAIEIEGLSPTDQEVSRFIDALLDLELVRRVRLEFTREQVIDGIPMREFRIVMSGDPDADIRQRTATGEDG